MLQLFGVARLVHASVDLLQFDVDPNHSVIGRVFKFVSRFIRSWPEHALVGNGKTFRRKHVVDTNVADTIVIEVSRVVSRISFLFQVGFTFFFRVVLATAAGRNGVGLNPIMFQ